ncbi:redoxin domain-containing protein [Micromonospora sp. ATCC 39149]|uniref:TlpA family protein disulfide reductase n=1 Tax=Micromonospora sp. (strain ATCC 39149 / NRRL 15099 / SCC 1413) TaxID=219305 RepID=UPI0001A50E94|nr:redoxin domain-containing protein [Micromonospora sp. ATCC 39149]EEP71099.1 redoxin domain-containing protein [Micromonospora sp. ATCC 39149]
MRLFRRPSRRRTGPGGRSPRRRRAGTAAGLVAVLLGTASCAVDTPAPVDPAAAVSAAPAGPPATPTGTPTGASPPPAAPARVPESLRFTGTTLDGKPFAAADLAGRPVVLWFWAPWCATCASQAWTVAEIAPQYRDRVPIVGVAGLGQQKAMKDFVTEFELGGTLQLDDRAGTLWRRFEIVEQSTFLIIDREGKVIHQGFLDGEDLTRRVAALAG